MIDSNGLPVTVIRDPDVSLAAGTNTVGGVELRFAGTDLSFIFGRASEPRNGNSLILPVQHVGSSIAGVSDTLWLAAQRITGTTESFYGAVRWREIM